MNEPSNQISVDDNGIIVIKALGPQNEISLTTAGDELRELIARLQAEHKPILVLDDITELGPVPPAGRKIVVSLGKTLQYDRLVMLGKPGSVIRIGANLLLSLMGRSGKTKYFDNREEAIKWLLS